MRLDHLLSKELDTVGCENGWINPTKTEEVENRRCVLLFSYQAETFLVPMRLGDTPVPIPNTTVKTQSADGTALETVWESRWAPDQKKTTGWKPDEDKTGIGKWVLSETGWSQIRIVKSGANPYQPGRAVKICWFYQWLEILNKKSRRRNIWCF